MTLKTADRFCPGAHCSYKYTDMHGIKMNEANEQMTNRRMDGWMDG